MFCVKRLQTTNHCPKFTHMDAKFAQDIDHYNDEGYISEEDVDVYPTLDSCQFLGRINELQVLKGVFQDVCKNNVLTAGNYLIPICLIDGYSGSGKTSLVSKFIGDLIKQQKLSKKGVPIFLKGKYDELQCRNPFSAIADALSEFLGGLLLGDKIELKRIRHRILHVMGIDEINILTTLIPDLKEVVGDGGEDYDYTPCTIIEESTAYNAWNRLKYAFLQFFQAICTSSRPIIMFLDDLHWADDASLAYIISLLTDTSLFHFMFIGTFTFKKHNTYENHLMRNGLKSVAAIRNSKRIKLVNLTMKETASFVSGILCLNEEDTKELTEKVHRKTQGNPFFIKQAIDELERKKVVFFCYMTFRWQWNIEKVDMHISDNVSITVLDKLRSLPVNVQRTLTTAAYVRSSFDIHTLQFLIGTDSSINPDELTKILEIAMAKGLLLKDEHSLVYNFSHDHIQCAACSLLSEEKNSFLFRVGKCLWELGLAECGEYWMLFVAADHLNSITLPDPDPLFIAKVNLKVGSIASCEQALSYLRIGVSSLEKFPNHWTDHYDMSLQIYQALADAEFFAGHFDEGSDLSRLLLKKAVCITDQIPTYFLFASAFHRKDLPRKSLKLHQTVLCLLGEYPKHFMAFHIIRIATKLWRYFKTKSDEEILILPMLVDGQKRAALKFLIRATSSAEITGKIQDFLLCILRGVEITIDSGICTESVVHLTNYGIFLNVIGNFKGALRLVALAEKVLLCYKSKETEALHIFSSNLLILSWNTPNSLELLNKYHHGYESGMQSGDIEAGLGNRFASNYLAYDYGLPLTDLTTATEETIAQSKLYNIKSVLQPVEQLSFFLSCLIGNKSIDWEYLKIVDNSHPGSQLRWAYWIRLQLGVYFSEYGFAKEMAKKLAPLCKNAAYGFCTIAINYWLFAFLVASNQSRQTGKRKYTIKAQNIAKEMIAYTVGRSNIFLNLRFLMEAELMSLKEKNAQKVQAAFDKAIVTAVRSCRIHYVALACEKAGEYFMSVTQKGSMLLYFTLARNCYRRWGALAKVVQLERKLGYDLNEIGLDSEMAQHICQYLSEYQTESKLMVVPAYIPVSPKCIRRKSNISPSRESISHFFP